MANSNRPLSTSGPSHNANSATSYHRRIRSNPDTFLSSSTTPTIHEDHNENLAFYSSSVALAMSKPGTKFTGRSRTLPPLPPSIYPARTTPKHIQSRSTSFDTASTTRECFTTVKYPTSSRPLPILPTPQAANNPNITVKPNVDANNMLPTPPVSPSYTPNVGSNTSFTQLPQQKQNPNPRRPLQNQQLPSPPSSGYSSPVAASFYGPSIPFAGQGGPSPPLYNSSQNASIPSLVSPPPTTRATTSSFSGSSSSYISTQNTSIPSPVSPPATRVTTNSFSGSPSSYASTQSSSMPSLATSIRPPPTITTETTPSPFCGTVSSYTTQITAIPALVTSISSTPSTAITSLQYDPSALYSSSHPNTALTQKQVEQSPSGPPITRATGSSALTVVQYNPPSSQEEQGPPVPPKDPPTSSTTSSRIRFNLSLTRQPTSSAPPSYVPIQSPTSPFDPTQVPPPPFQPSTSLAQDIIPQDSPKARPSNERQKSRGKGKAFAKAGLRIAGKIGLSLAKKAIVSTITGSVDVGSLIPSPDQIADLAAEWNPLEDGVKVGDGDDLDAVVDVQVDTGDIGIGGEDLAVEGADASIPPQPMLMPTDSTYYGLDTPADTSTNGYEVTPNMDKIISTGAHLAANMLSPRRR